MMSAQQNAREEHRPWGFYTVLSDEPDHKVKRIVVYPGRRLSLQRHRHRSEHWNIVRGEALVTIDDHEFPLKKGMSCDVPTGATHRIKSTGIDNLVFIEIQQGDYFGEDDIERLEDDFGRIDTPEN
ncbi:MAG: phosphomannose isomerase type II C-terminal cupin domain [Deltaproteobacteria bacterium]|nr:MAG: phosphomannose isomerase type II C-terminal cupin domain [Deltaproteobacteria bacterium]